MFYQGAPIDNWTHVTGTVAQSSAESDNNAAWTTGMALSHLRMLNNELLNKDTDVAPEKALLIILDIKPDICMDNNGKDTKHTRKITTRMHLVRNGE